MAFDDGAKTFISLPIACRAGARPAAPGPTPRQCARGPIPTTASWATPTSSTASSRRLELCLPNSDGDEVMRIIRSGSDHHDRERDRAQDQEHVDDAAEDKLDRDDPAWVPRRQLSRPTGAPPTPRCRTFSTNRRLIATAGRLSRGAATPSIPRLRTLQQDFRKPVPTRSSLAQPC
jgi:hypothetical protein